jgi:hypothetical protein
LSIFDCRFSIASIVARRYPAQGQDCSILNRKSTIDNCQEALTLRDVKNEGTSGDVYENTGDDDNMSGEKPGFYTKMRPIHDYRQQSVGIVDRGYTGYAINRGEGGPKISSSAHRSTRGARSWF